MPGVEETLLQVRDERTMREFYGELARFVTAWAGRKTGVAHPIMAGLLRMSATLARGVGMVREDFVGFSGLQWDDAHETNPARLSRGRRG